MGMNETTVISFSFFSIPFLRTFHCYYISLVELSMLLVPRFDVLTKLLTYNSLQVVRAMTVVR